MPHQIAHTDTMLRNLMVNAYTLGASILTYVEQITHWLALLGVLAGIVGSLYTIINQRRKYLDAREAAFTELVDNRVEKRLAALNETDPDEDTTDG